MRLPPLTKTMYCEHPRCENARGVDVRWYPDSDDGPGWPYIDECPLCRGNLRMDPPPELEEADE